jgi:hypothetical protein
MSDPLNENPPATAIADGQIEKQLNAPDLALGAPAGKADPPLPYLGTAAERRRAALRVLAERLRRRL